LTARTINSLFDPWGGIPYNGLYGDAPPEKGPFVGSRYGKGVPFSGWRYVKGVPFQE